MRPKTNSTLKKIGLTGLLATYLLAPKCQNARDEALPYQKYFSKSWDMVERLESGEEIILEEVFYNVPRFTLSESEGHHSFYQFDIWMPEKPETGCISYHMQSSTDGINFKDFNKQCTSEELYRPTKGALGCLPLNYLFDINSTIDPDTREKVLPESVFVRILIRPCKEHSGSRGNGR